MAISEITSPVLAICYGSHFLHNFHLFIFIMSKRPSRNHGDTERAKGKLRVVESQDDEGQQEIDVEMNTPSVQEPQDADVQLGPPLSTSQVTSDNDLAVPGKPRSKMVKDHRTPDSHARLDALIFGEYSSIDSGFFFVRLESGLRIIASQNGYDINPVNMFEVYDWLRDLLVDQWNNKSFMKVRRLGECRPNTFSVNSVA